MTVVEKIQDVIERQIRPALQSHGGDIEFVDFRVGEGLLQVRLTGACGGCPFATETLRVQVEGVIREEIPEVLKVEKA